MRHHCGYAPQYPAFWLKRRIIDAALLMMVRTAGLEPAIPGEGGF